MTHTGASQERIPALDGIRAVAILAVVAYHAGVPGAGGGFVGVDVFFVLSGFLITGILLKDAESGGISLVDFYARRARRLVPALTLMLLVVNAASWLWVPEVVSLRVTATSTVASSLFGQNFYQLTRHADYFEDPGYQNPLLHAWSLSVEEQFYAVWPLLLIAAVYAAKRFGARALPLVTIATITLLSLALVVLGDLNPMVVFYSPLSRAWELGAGAVLACVLTHRRESVPNVVGAIGLLGVIASVVVLDDSITTAPWKMLLPVLATVALIVDARLAPRSVTNRVLSAAPLVWIGERSYGWYLWHFPALVIGQRVLGTSPLATLSLIALSLVVAHVSYRFVELPIRRQQIRFLASTPRTLIAAGVAIALSLGVGFKGRTAAFAIRGEGPWSWLSGACPGSTQEQFDRGDICDLGSADSTRQLLLWGDSQARAVAPLLDTLGKDLGFRVTVRTLAACRPFQPPQLAADTQPCIRFNDSVFAELDRNRSRYDGVVLVGRWASGLMVPPRDPIRLAQHKRGIAGRDTTALRRRGVDRLQLMLTRLDAIGQHVLVLARSPEWRRDPADCRRLPPDTCNDFEKDLTAYHQPAADIFRAAATGTRVRILDLQPMFCSSGTCSQIRDGVPAFFDGTHLSSAGARGLVNETRCAFVALVERRPQMPSCPALVR